MIGELYINDKDAWITYGVVLDEGREEELLLPAPIKEITSNNMASQHGKQIFTNNIKVDERNLTLVFCFEWATNYIERYDKFVEELQKGPLVLKIPQLKKGFKLTYSSCRNFSSIKYAGKILVNFNEPNPKDRIKL